MRISWFVLLSVWLFFCYGRTECFTPNNWVRWFIWQLGDTRDHERLTKIAMCIVQHKWLVDNKGLNLPEPLADGSEDDRCPYSDWFFAVQSLSIINANMAAQYVADEAGEPDMKSSMVDDPAFHFDSDVCLQDTNRRLNERRGWIIRAIRSMDKYSAANEIRTEIGYYLHTLQDFYSHTNWVELGMTEANKDIGIRDFSIPIAPFDLATCSNCNNLVDADEYIFSLYDKAVAAMAYLKGFRISNVYVCKDNLLQTGYLTSGYYGGQETKKPQPGMKCSHGGGLDSTSGESATGGINKDTNTFLFSPHHYLHFDAAQLAAQASIEFLQGLRTEVADDGKFGRVLGLNLPRAIGFIIDTTDSLSILVANIFATFIFEKQTSRATSDVLYYLTPFNDPDYGPVQYFSDSSSLLTALAELHAHGGGGDTPEMCLPALLKTAETSIEGAELFVFTDSPSKLGQQLAEIKMLAMRKALSISFLIPDGLSNNGTADKFSPTKSSFVQLHALALKFVS